MDEGLAVNIKLFWKQPPLCAHLMGVWRKTAGSSSYLSSSHRPYVLKCMYARPEYVIKTWWAYSGKKEVLPISNYVQYFRTGIENFKTKCPYLM
jgi:hypothetical protein